MRYNLDRPHVFVSTACAGAKGAGGWGRSQKALLINLSLQQSPQKTHTDTQTHTLIPTPLAWHDLHEPLKILWRSFLLFCLVALLCLCGSRVEHEQRATPPMNQPPDAPKSNSQYCYVNSKQHHSSTNEKGYGFTKGGAELIINTGYIIAHIRLQVSGKMLMQSLSIISALANFIVGPDESTSRFHSFIHLRAAPSSSEASWHCVWQADDISVPSGSSRDAASLPHQAK